MMYNLADERPAEGTWVYWVAIEQCDGRLNSGLSKWREKDYENLTEEGLTSFWINADNIAEKHIAGRLVEIFQQLEENSEQRGALKDLRGELQEQFISTSGE